MFMVKLNEAERRIEALERALRREKKKQSIILNLIKLWQKKKKN